MTEGKKSEPNYLKALCKHFELATADVKIFHPEGTDPITLTTKAIKLRNERKRLAKQGNGVAYDEVWVVFDLEKPHDQRRKLAVTAKTIKDVEGIKFAISDPCFEYWLLLHEEDTTAPLTNCDAATRRLKAFWPSYAKDWIIPPEFLKKLPDAIVRAKRCREYHLTAGGDGNPATGVDLLTRSLNEATRKHLQFLLA